MLNYQKFTIPTIQDTEPTGWEGVSKNIGDAVHAFVSRADEERKRREMFQSEIDLLQAKSRLEQLQNQANFQNSIKMMKDSGIFGDGGPAGQMQPPVGQPQIGQPPNAASQPQLPADEAMPPMFINKPSYNLDPSSGKMTIGISPIPNPLFQNKMDIEKAKQNKIITGVSGEVGGRVALANESIKNIADMKKILFPTGEPSSFRRGVAFGSNLPAARIPLIGPITPKLSPVHTKEMEDVFRKGTAVLAARQLIQTGVAARPEETENLRQAFLANLFSNPEAALQGLNELEDFYRNYLNKTDPSIRFGGSSSGSTNNEYEQYLQAIGEK